VKIVIIWLNIWSSGLSSTIKEFIILMNARLKSAAEGNLLKLEKLKIEMIISSCDKRRLIPFLFTFG
jgi:hypothetical protein